MAAQSVSSKVVILTNDPSIRNERLYIEGKPFFHLHTREYTPVSIYKGEHAFLRIGPRRFIASELGAHRLFEKVGFPVSSIISEGQNGSLLYYIETSLGSCLLLEGFQSDFTKDRVVSNSNFYRLLSVTKKCAAAQLKGKGEVNLLENCSTAIHLKELIEELPYLRESILGAYTKSTKRVACFPIVPTQGDFSAVNLFDAGLIDFERAFAGPFGYDIITNIFHTYCYPLNGDYEKTRGYEFSEQQIANYFSVLDSICSEHNVPNLSDFIQDFLMLRIIMFTARMHSRPKLQRWVYERFRTFVEGYLADRNIAEIMFQ